MHHHPVVSAFVLAVALVCASACLVSPVARDAAAQEATLVVTAAHGDFSGKVAVGDHELWLKCRGEGSPTVILESGFRTRADVWTEDLLQTPPREMVFPGVSRFTRVCAYDRPGTATVSDGQLLPSRSDAVPMPRTAQETVSDLHALLAATGIPGPYVLVGHSFGGLFVRLFTATYPEEVVGLVLVDAFPETMKDDMTSQQWKAYDEIFQPVPPELAGYDDLEFTELDISVEQMRQAAAAHPLPATLPVVVLSRGQAMAMPADLPGGLTGELLERAWQAGQDDLASLTPDVRHIVATESEHYIQLQQPDLVITAVRDVVEAVRDPSTWATAEASPVS